MVNTKRYKRKDKMNLKTKFMNLVRENINISKKISVGLLSFMIMLSLLAPVVNANDFQPNPDTTKDAEVKANEAANSNAKTPKTIFDDEQGNGLEIGPEIVGQPVRATKLPQPTNVEVRAGANPKISGKVEGSGDRKIRRRVFAYEKDPNTTPNQEELGVSGAVRPVGTFSIKSKKPLTKDQVIYLVVKQEKKNSKIKWEPDPDFPDSDPLAVTVLPTFAEEYDGKIKVPADTFFTEDKFSVTNEEQAEILDAFKRDNPTIAENIKKIEIGAGNSSELTATLKYKDDSTSKTYKLKRGLITEKSAIPEIEKVCVTADKIVGKFKIEEGKTLSPDTKVQMIFNFTDGEEKNFCEEENCKFDKSTGYFATVDIQNGTFTIDVKDDQLILGKEFGIVVKEKHKFASCIKAQPSLAIPEKTFVRDPNKLTEAEKTEIETALRKANITESGKSKFPDGTGFLNGIPAIIEYDQKGNVIILNPNDIEVSDWDDAGKPIFVKNPDGSYKLKQGSENNVNKIPVKDLVKNLAPKKPMINVDTDAGKVTVTPPVYVNPGDDTDLASYTVKYKDSSDAEKTVTLTRTVDSKGVTTWGAPAGVTVDKSTGVVTLDIKDLALGATIKATAKDKGGLTQEETPLDSDENQLTLEKVKVTYDPNKGSGTMEVKEINKGLKYKILENKFIAPNENQMFDTWEIDGKRVAPGTEIVVTKDTVVKALWKSIPVKVTYDGNGGKGTMDGKTLNKGDTYKVLDSTFTAPDENHQFDTWEIDGKRVAPGTEIVVTKDTVVKALWKKIPVQVTYDGNGGKGTMDGKSLFKGDSYKVLDSTFTAPDENHQFDTWEIDGKRVAPGTEIVVTKDTVVKALWKSIPVKVTYDGNGGKGTMDGKTLNKGDTYKVLASTFTAPNNKKFKAWEVNGKEVSAGIEITVDKDIVVKAIWEDDKKPGTSDGSTSKPGSKDKNGTQSRGTSKLNSRNNGAPSTGDNGMNMLYAFGLAFAACGVIVMNRISRKEKEDLLNESKQ